MTTRSTRRRAALLAAMTATVTAAGVAGAVAAGSDDARGTIAFEGGAPIPEGCIALHLEDPAVGDATRPSVGAPCVESDGKSTTISFSVPASSGSAASRGSRIVAGLRRSDGWLIARGSARLDADASVHVTLYRAMH